jgi:hypothetical protein
LRELLFSPFPQPHSAGVLAGQLAAVQNMAANLAGIAAPILTGVLKQMTGG